MVIQGNHHGSTSTRRTVVGSSFCVTHIIQQTTSIYYVWVLMAFCLLMICHQVYQTQKAMQLLTQLEPPPALDFFSLSWQRYNVTVKAKAANTKNNKGDNVTLSHDDEEEDEEDDDDSSSPWNDNNNAANRKNDQEHGDVFRQHLQEQMNILASKGKGNATAYMELYERAGRQRRPYPHAATRTANVTRLRPPPIPPHVRTYDEVKRDSYSYQINEAWRPPNMDTTDYSRLPALPRDDVVLPDMTEGGGVIFFLHVPKTAGQTIRQFNWRFIRHMKRQKARERKMARRTERKRNQRREGPLGSGGDAAAAGGGVSNAAAENDDQPPSPEVEAFHALCQDKVNYVTANTLEVFQQKTVSQVNYYLQSKNHTKGKVLFIEVHGMDNYHVLELEPYLHYWRELSKQSGVPFFAFTLLREPISLHVSFFNFYYIHVSQVCLCLYVCVGVEDGTPTSQHKI